ncbi:MAG: type I methionyl aminopeptidase [Oscillospiraceae bacterium]|jgi:methionyl aminopeptidase|nr:type I methionyl aminopeptidase [Oscillospiraceae bacterium]
MIQVKSPREIDAMRRAGEITGQALAEAKRIVAPGITTKQVDSALRRVIEKSGAIPAFLGYNGFPGAVCVSVNREVIHGIPGSRVLREGDIVSIDVGAVWNGFYGDAAATFPVGQVSDEALRLIRVTRESFYQAAARAREGCRVSDISHAVQTHAEAAGYTLVREWTGHGVGSKLHEDPEVPNFGPPGHGPRLLRGMTIAVEPMVNAGSAAVRVLKDGWTVVTADGKLSAHYEHSILITAGEPELLTRWEETPL